MTNGNLRILNFKNMNKLGFFGYHVSNNSIALPFDI